MSFLNELIDCPLNLLEIEKKFGLRGYGFIEYSKRNKNLLHGTHFRSIPFYFF